MRVVLLLSLAALLASTLATDILSDSKSQPLLFKSKDLCSDEKGCPPKPAKPCNEYKCKLPDCRCSRTGIPGGLSVSETPQMIVLTFQSGIRKLELAKYQSLFAGRPNPNGCPGTGTFFVSHEHTDYYSVQTLRSERHEIGVNGVNATHEQDWWKDASEKEWTDEMQGEREILKTLANIPKEQVLGERAPYLQMGGDNQISALKSSKFLYDVSRVSVNSSNPPNLLWPYTYDYASTQDCVVPNCATKSFTGFWQVPLLALTDQYGNYCPKLDACNVTTPSEVFELLYNAFNKHSLSNKAPLVLTLSARWVQDVQKMKGTTDFLTYLIGLKVCAVCDIKTYYETVSGAFCCNSEDVYLVSADRMLAWIKKPTKLNDLSFFKPFMCDQTPPPVCTESEAFTCRYDKDRKIVNGTAGVVYRTTTCLECPDCYPWVGDTAGKNC